MNLQSKLNEFYTSLNEISIINNNLDDKRDDLKNIIYNFNNDIQHLSLDKELLQKNKQLGNLLESTIVKLKSSSKHWVENFEKLLLREKFRSDLENYFIVIIFGKVKAGKSSLGNFIAKNKTTDAKVEFFRYDSAGNEQEIKKLEEIDDENEFATDNLECTVEIQGFRLNGLAWIDTPGLGSMVKENGDLATKYIQSADYIIYPTSSNSPLQQDEIAQIKELFEQKKPVTICITKSDTQQRKKDAQGNYIKDNDGKIPKFLTNKNTQDRDAQEEYVKSEILKIANNNDYLLGDILSISSHTAQKGIKENDNVLLEGSNILKFYDLITDVIKKKAKTLKEKTPYNGLYAFVDNELLSDENNANSVNSLKVSLNNFDTQIDEAIERFEIIKKNTNSDIEAEIDYIVSRHISQLDKGNEKDVFAQIDTELGSSISLIIDNNIKEILSQFHASLNSISKSLKDASQFKIEDEYRTIEVWYEDRSLLNKVTLGAFGRSHSSMEETILVGNNKNAVIANFKNTRREGYLQTALEMYSKIVEDFFNPLQNISKEMRKKIETLEKNVVLYKKKLGK